jgi:CheY-like chemotaxis protein
MRGPVLIVEDHADTREALALVLRGEGWDTRGAHDGGEALSLVRAGLEPGLILLDLTLPDLDGWQVLAELRAIPALGKVPIVVLSGEGSAAAVRQAGATDYLRKPFDVEALLGLVRPYCAD